MANEQVFRSPGFFPREIDQSIRVSSPAGTAAGIIGTSPKGPAFVPTLVNSFKEFTDIFGELNGKHQAQYAIKELLRNGGKCIFVRVLGAGANTTQDHVNTTNSDGRVHFAGFQLSPTTVKDKEGVNQSLGAVTILAASHSQQNDAYPLIEESRFSDKSNAPMIRAILFSENNSRVFVSTLGQNFEHGLLFSTGTINLDGHFVIYVSSSNDGTSFGSDEGRAGVKAFTASLNPNSTNYISKILNTDPTRLNKEKHVLYASFDVDDEVATATNRGVAMLSGSTDLSNDAAVNFLNAFGRFDTRYTTPSTPWITSQPFGNKEYNLFKVESISDGVWANTKYKISVVNLKKSTDLNNPYGSFTLVVRDFNDSDESPKVVESFPNLTLNQNSDDFIGRRIGDKKLKFDFDQQDENERRLKSEGRFDNVSRTIRVVLHDDLLEGRVPADTLPCGFRGYELLKTTRNELSTGTTRFYSSGSEAKGGWILPPIPFRRKLTKNQIGTNKERIDARLNWGVQFSRISGSATEPNKSGKHNFGINAFTKFLGIRDFDMLITGTYADTFCNNKFSLSRVRTRVGTTSNLTTSSFNDTVKDFVYVRSGTFTDKSLTDVLMEPPDSNGNIDITFNRFSAISGFNLFLAGGFDGVDITDENTSKLDDKAASTATNGGANTSYTNSALGADQTGTDLNNSAIQTYRRAIEALSDPDAVDINLLAIPGIREPLVTDYAADKMRDRFDAFYVMDIEEFDKNATRLFEDSTIKPDVNQTRDKFMTRGVDNNFAASYFPDVVLQDSDTGKRLTVAPSVVVMGTYAFNDRVGQAWFAPAGFNRGALSTVTEVDVRLTQVDRDKLYEASINPIASFPREGFVVFGQKTLQQAQSALDRVNVRRLLIEVRRAVRQIGNSVLFEPHRASTIEKFRKRLNPLLERIQLQAGIDRFKIVIDETTTTPEDVNNNTLKGKIFIVPAKTVEFIALDFIVTQDGVQFE